MNSVRIKVEYDISNRLSDSILARVNELEQYSAEIEIWVPINRNLLWLIFSREAFLERTGN